MRKVVYAMRIVAVILAVLQAVFLTLKLTSFILWSWGLILLPLWISLAVLAAFVFLAVKAADHVFREING